MNRNVVVLLAALSLQGAAAAAQTSVPCSAPAGTAPASVTATSVPPNVNVAWTTVTGGYSYAVVRRNPDGSCWAISPGLTTTSFQEPAPTAVGTYGYQVAVRFSSGQIGLSQWASYVVQDALMRPRDLNIVVMSDALPPVNLAAAGTPTTATISWGAPAGAVQYRVNRAPAGTTSWTAVTATPITATTVTDVLPNPAQPYLYSVLAYRSDGHYGEASVGFTAPPPTNPKGLVGAASGVTVSLSWQPVQYAARYLVSGPGIAGTAPSTGTSFEVAAAPAGSNVYRVGSVFEPGALSTPSSTWPSVTVPVAAPVTCACPATGPFVPPAFSLIKAKGLSGTFTSGSDTYTITAQSVNGNDILDVKDPQKRTVLSVTNPAGWGISPGGIYFVVSTQAFSTNTAADVAVYRVERGPRQWTIVLNVSAPADGTWGFSSEASQFIVSRLQNTRFSAQAYNLKASNPRAAVAGIDDTNVSGATLTTSPCGDRLLYFRWYQTNPLAGQGDFFTRSKFGSQLPIVTVWDGVSQTTPGAAVAAGPSLGTFLLQLSGLRTQNGQQTLASTQCTP